LNCKWAQSTAGKCIEAINRDDKEGFWKVMSPVLDAKIPFPLLDEIGKLLGETGKLDRSRYFRVFDDIVVTDKMGGYVIVGQTLAAFFETDLEEAIVKAREVVIKGKTWYVCDIVGDRVFGQALVKHFEPTIVILEDVTSLEEPEVRRSIGVGVHFFAKSKQKDIEGIRRLLSVLSNLVGDRRVFVVKGVGWGLKTIGIYQPEPIVEYLQETLQTTKISN
jgi:3-methyladenine DNA glycosylase AlkD